FASKDDLVLARLLASTDELEQALSARPGSESAWPALHAAFTAVVCRRAAHDATSRRLHQMLHTEDGVRAVLEEWRRRWTQQLLPLVAQRLPPGTSHTAALAVT